jgi:hypothetical protein
MLFAILFRDYGASIARVSAQDGTPASCRQWWFNLGGRRKPSLGASSLQSIMALQWEVVS